MTYAEYLVFEAASLEKHEWFDGQIFAMAGGTEEHAFLGAAVTGEVRTALRGSPCRPCSPDLRVRSNVTGLATYPDLTVLCGPREPHLDDKDAATNPTVVVEVLSPSTEGYDRGQKFEHYQTFASLRDYVLVATGRNHIDHYTRNADGSWTLRGYGPGDAFTLSGVEATVQVDAIYAGVDAVRETAAP
jgi:Uma2 family endonuclease